MHEVHLAANSVSFNMCVRVCVGGVGFTAYGRPKRINPPPRHHQKSSSEGDGSDTPLGPFNATDVLRLFCVFRIAF